MTAAVHATPGAAAVESLADTLRRAAVRLRKAAVTAPRGAVTTTAQKAAYITVMNPDVAVKLAKLLDVEADVADNLLRRFPDMPDTELSEWLQEMLGLAHLVLGEEHGSTGATDWNGEAPCPSSV